ncbi:LOW QUALITY PROTEIN: uncharacterized protein LOC122947288 [Acropora millepora]|uniref:LOW QUALITY PROTEIN: uncharacterized protein LOC122947288 n=1 Tax=Acropora millepora TaxID=45264 RepID=UPI001CF1F885|nr:LOW QUALITY PROTEIN: uncharacterized protein LOC122947288 [Acropora millepora]
MHQDAGKLQTKADLLEDLRINASSEGFEIIDNDGGGNCMFHALCDQLKCKKNLKISHQELRKQLVKYLQEHPKMSDGTEIASSLDTHRFPSWAEYLQKMAQDEWGDQRIILAAANWSQCNIRVISSIPSYEVTMSPLQPNSDADVLVLGYVVGLHYVSLRRLTSDSPSQVQEEPGDSRDWSLSSLEISSFESDIEYFAKYYDADTRHWLFSDFDRWFSDPGDSRAYVLLGDAGVGKTVIAAALAKRTQADGRLGACYFCRHNDNTRNNPRSLIGTVAYQLCKCNKDYRTKVGGESSVRYCLANLALGFNELFTKLLHEPLGKCNTCSQRMLVIIDALDETNYESREDFLELLKARFPLLPKWLVFFITSRPEDTVQFYLERYNPCIKICAGNGQDEDSYLQHKADIRRFLEKKVNFSELPYSVEDVVAKCNGLFLYAYYISEVLSDRTSAIEGVNLADHFPGDIESFFLTNFKRVFDNLSEAGLYWKLFGCVIAAPTPLPLSFISFILENENSNLDVQTVIDAVSQFAVVRKSDNTFLFSHNLIPSWLTSEKKASRKLFIDRDKASEYFKKIILTFLHSASSDELEEGFSVNQDVLNYLLHVGVRFLCCNYDNKDTMTTVFSSLTNFHFLQKRVDTDGLEIFSVVSDYKLCLHCQSLADAEKVILQEIYAALEKNVYVLVESPHLLPSCLRCTSEATQRKLGVPDDSFMECKSLDFFPYLAPTLSCKDIVFALSPEKKLLAAGDRLNGVVRMYDACSLKEVLGPVECQTKIDHLVFSRDGKFLLFGMEGRGLSVDRGRVEEISYREERVAEKRRHSDACCFARALILWAKFSLIKDCHTSVCSRADVSLAIAEHEFLLRKVRCLLEVVEGCLKLEGDYFPLKALLEYFKFLFDFIGLGPFFDEHIGHTHRRLLEKKVLECLHWCRYCEQEQRLTDFIQRIVGMAKWEDVLKGTKPCANLYCDLLLCVTRLMAASRKLPSAAPVEFRDRGANDMIAQSSQDGKVIAVRDPPFPKRVEDLLEDIFLDDWNLEGIKADDRQRSDTIKVVMNIIETDETEFFTDPVYVITHVEAFAFTCNSDFVVYVQKEGQCFQALSLQTGSILSCDSGFSPVFHIQSQQVGFVFRAGSEKSFVPISDFLVSSALGKYLVLPVVTSTGWPSGITFTLGGNISYLSPNLMQCIVTRNGDGSSVISAKRAPLENPDGCEVENCALSRQGKSIAISQKASIFLFGNRASPCPVFKESEDTGCQVSCLMFSHDGTLLLYCVERRNSKAEVCLWNVDQNEVSSHFFASTLVSINCCCFSPDNSIVILCGELRIEIFENDLCSYQCLKIVKGLTRLYPINESFRYCSVSSGNEVLACCIMNDVLLYSLSSPGKESFYCRLPPAHSGQISFCQLLSETSYLISYGIDGAVFLWDLVHEKAVAYVRVTEREESITGMSVSSTEDEVVCLTSLGRVIMIELHGLNEPRCHLNRCHWMRQKTINIRSLSWISETGTFLEQESLGN